MDNNIKIITFFPLVAALVSRAGPVAAQGINSILKTAGDAAKYETNAVSSPGTLVGKIILPLLALLGVIFVGLTVYAGFLWMTAKGESSQTQKARDILSNSLIGLIIVVGAYAITYFVLYYVTKGQITNSGFN